MSGKENVKLQNAMDEHRGRKFEFSSGQGRATYLEWKDRKSGQETRILSKHLSISRYEQ
jgi:hypothetical protein